METSGAKFAIDDRGAVDLFGAPNLTGTPERNLLMAILERAILDFVGNEPKEAADAGNWISEDLKNPTFREYSFPWVCLQLDLDYQQIADQIMNMPKRGNSRIAPWYLNKNYSAKERATELKLRSLN